MNCLDKMYKEIEEINKREVLEKTNAIVVKEIKHSFSADFEEVKPTKELIDYLSLATFEGGNWNKKYFNEEKAKSFAVYIFKKFYCFNKCTLNLDFEVFIKDLIEELKKEDIFSALTKKTNELKDFCSLDDEEYTNFFTNPYNALYKDENGYYAVIDGNRFSNVKKPFGYIKNQLKKVVKEMCDIYIDNYADIMPVKEVNAFKNYIKAEVNKMEEKDENIVQNNIENLIFEKVSKFGESREDFDNFIKTKGLRLISQGNFYFHKKEFEDFKEYKNIEFRY